MLFEGFDSTPFLTPHSWHRLPGPPRSRLFAQPSTLPLRLMAPRREFTALMYFVLEYLLFAAKAVTVVGLCLLPFVVVLLLLKNARR